MIISLLLAPFRLFLYFYSWYYGSKHQRPEEESHENAPVQKRTEKRTKKGTTTRTTIICIHDPPPVNAQLFNLEYTRKVMFRASQGFAQTIYECAVRQYRLRNAESQNDLVNPARLDYFHELVLWFPCFTTEDHWHIIIAIVVWMFAWRQHRRVHWSYEDIFQSCDVRPTFTPEEAARLGPPRTRVLPSEEGYRFYYTCEHDCRFMINSVAQIDKAAGGFSFPLRAYHPIRFHTCGPLYRTRLPSGVLPPNPGATYPSEEAATRLMLCGEVVGIKARATLPSNAPESDTQGLSLFEDIDTTDSETLTETSEPE